MKMVKPVKGSLEINYSGKNGIKGNDGFNAIHNGDSGSNGLSGSNGQNGLPINVNLHVENGKIIVMENNCFGHSFRLGERDNKLLLISSGGDGGEGGNGGFGANGHKGRDGDDANQFFEGTNGERGGDAGNGGHAGNGGFGGNGGDINVFLGMSETDLLMILDSYYASGGIGGKPGQPGAKGSGGEGGLGGKPYHWTETLTDENGITRNEHHTKNGGCNGKNGHDGIDGYKGVAGSDGTRGYFKIIVNFGNRLEAFSNKYCLHVTNFDVLNSDDMIFEPGEEVFITNISLSNIGGMPTPEQEMVGIIKENDGFTFNYEDRIQIPKGIMHGHTVSINCRTKILLEYKYPLYEGIPREILTISPLSLLTRVNKDFGISLSKNIEVRWPVEISVPIVTRSISIEEEAPFSIEIRNISTMSIGKDSNIPRNMSLVLEPYLADMGFQFIEEDGTIKSVNEKVIKEFSLQPLESIKFSGTFRFEDPNTPNFTKKLIKASLYLGNRNEIRTKIIQFRKFDIQLSERFSNDKEADCCLIVNSEVEKIDIEHFKEILNRFKLKLNIWNASLYKGFSYNFKVLNSFDFANEMKNKVVIIANNEFKNNKNKSKTILKYIFSDEIFQAAKTQNISTMIIGDKKEYDQIHLPKKDLRVVPHRNIDEFILKEKKLWKRKIQISENVSGHTGFSEPLLEINSDDIENQYDSIPIYRSYACCNSPKKEHIVEEVTKLERKLQELFPNFKYFFFYDYSPKKNFNSGFCSSEYHLGDVEIRKGLNKDRMFDDCIASSNSTNLRDTDNQEIFGIIKLLPFKKKLQILVNNLDNQNELVIINSAILSDLIEELDIYRQNKKIGLINPNILGKLMIDLNSFLNNDYLQNILSDKRGVEMMKINLALYSQVLCKITSFTDYICCGRNKKLVRTICENKITRFIEANLRLEINDIKLRIKDLNLISENLDNLIKSLINPYSKKIVFDKDFSSGIFEKDKININSVFSNKKIKINSNRFYDPISGYYNVEARNAALQLCKEKCYFDTK